MMFHHTERTEAPARKRKGFALPMAILPALGLLMGKHIHARFEAVQSHFSDLTTLAQEHLAGVRIVRAWGVAVDSARRVTRDVPMLAVPRDDHLACWGECPVAREERVAAACIVED